jgi:hypothetical protein
VFTPIGKISKIAMAIACSRRHDDRLRKEGRPTDPVQARFGFIASPARCCAG